MNLDLIIKAAEAALAQRGTSDIVDTVLSAASGLSPDASDFDRGMAAGFAVAKLLQQQSYEIEQDNPLSSISP